MKQQWGRVKSKRSFNRLSNLPIMKSHSLPIELDACFGFRFLDSDSIPPKDLISFGK